MQCSNKCLLPQFTVDTLTVRFHEGTYNTINNMHLFLTNTVTLVTEYLSSSCYPPPYHTQDNTFFMRCHKAKNSFIFCYKKPYFYFICHSVTNGCSVWSLLNYFFNLSPYITVITSRLNYKVSLFGLSAHLSKIPASSSPYCKHCKAGVTSFLTMATKV